MANLDFENVHWADYAAKQVLERFPKEEVYTVASGITPSGIIHVGHFREIITSELVRKSLEKKGKQTKFIYSWDSYDVFRKVPKNIPEEWEKYLRLPDSKVPDPWKTYESFAEHFMQEAEESLKVFNFPIEFQRQHNLQTSGMYADGIRAHLRKRNEIRELINKFREDNPLPEFWMPLSVYSEKTGKDTTKILSYDEEYTIEYECKETGFKNKIDFRKTPIVKLSWRLDWPMRWAYYHVTYEPGGKDHSTPGGSYDTGCDIVKLVSNREPPVYTFYNFVRMKGQGGKVSSSTGDGATIADVLQVYTPELVLFLFAGTRPNAEFDISFDLDVIKIYEDFDKVERIYYGLEEEKNPKKLATLKRIYELSMVNGREVQDEMPYQPSFRHLTTVSQANDMNFEQVLTAYPQVKTEFEKLRLKERFECVKNWLKTYAPEEMVFLLNKKVRELDDNERKILIEVKTSFDKHEDPRELATDFKQIAKDNGLDIKEFFAFMYNVLINKDKGPKLSSFMIDNRTQIEKLLERF